MEPWEIARSFEGVPFLHMGRSRKGVDCVGLLVLIAKECGWTPSEPETYGREPARNNNSFHLADYLRRNLGDPVTRPIQPNDVLLMKLRPRFAPAHVAMVAPHKFGLGIIHSYGEVGKVVFQRLDERRKRQIVEVFEWPAKH